MIRPKVDKADLRGIGRALTQAFPIDPGDKRAPAYGPDVAADARMDQLIDRLKDLPGWDDGPGHASGGEL